jgi:hypothetical protein
MLTLEALFAVLQGLRPDHLTHLEPIWKVFCDEIHQELNKGHDPLTALTIVLDQAEYGVLNAINRLLSQIQPAMQLPGLTFRQKEVLIALRYAKVASLAQLSRELVEDRRNTYRRLTALVKKGLALKFFRKDGVFYFAIPAALDHSVKDAVFHLIADRARQFSEAQAAKSTTPTTSTTRQKSTTSTTSTTR